MKDYIFIEKKTNYPFWISIVVIFLLAGLVGKMEVRELELKREIQARKNVSVHSWIMDESCSKQLLTSDTLRLKLK